MGVATAEDFMIVGLGASAGGIQALREFFEHVPDKTGMAFVVVLHLSPEYESRLAEVLQHSTPLPVQQVTERVRVEPDHVYVISPNRSLTMADGHLTVSELTRIEERRAPVDVFFRTLADSHGSRAVSVVLSGTGANGSMGIKRVKERGGICLVQDPEEAEYPEMPRHSIATELVDHVVKVAEMPARILAYRDRLGSVRILEEPNERVEADERALREIVTRMRTRTGHDFSNYKRATMLRRIERRIGVHQLDGLASYARHIRDNPAESLALLKDLLISVTNFFRDAEVFSTLERTIIPRLLVGKTEDDQVRVWVAGCATGEEAYSIAMQLAEQSASLPRSPTLQVFATDIDEVAIAAAREGLYTLNDAADVSPDRMRRFFTKEGDRYRVRKELREMVLFAHHNLIKDPPFSHLDLVACRNLLIYLNRSAQSRAIEVLHFALNPGGYLLLGSSESADGSSDLFAVVDKDAHLYQSRAVAPRLSLPVAPVVVHRGHLAPREPLAELRPRERTSFPELHQRLLEQYAPPSVVVDEDHEIVHLSARAGQFLRFAGGEPSQNLLRVVRPELRLDLRTALSQAAQHRTDVQARNVTLRIDERQITLNLLVRPVLNEADPARGFFLVVFEETAAGPGPPVAASAPVSTTEPARQLEEELLRLKGQLRSTVEQHETQAEELKASNEELQAINEELRSATEELETSREELQSVNEELRTVNQELKIKIEEQSQANNDIQNLVNSTDIGTVFLDRSSRIKFFTPRAREIFSFITTDMGRPLSDINCLLVNTALQADIDRVLERVERIEREVETRDGRWQLMRIVPYRTADEHVDGAVLTFVDVTERLSSEQQLREADRRKNEFLATLAHELRNPLAPLQTALEIMSVPDVGSDVTAQARDTMQRQLTQLVRLVDDLLDISRITLGKVTLRRTRVVLADAARTAVESVQPLIVKGRHALTVRLPDESLEMDGDPVRVAQILSNLLNNAAKYTASGGHIELSAVRDGNHVTIAVRDDGRGIPRDMLPRVFDIFLQGPESGFQPQSGLGLGLTLVKALVELHGGTVEARSGGVGLGSEFLVRLPLLIDAHQESVPAGRPPVALSMQRILVVDDNEDAANSIGMLLGMLGADVRVFYDGESALALLAAFGPTIALLDIGMPGMNGLELARHIRRTPGQEGVRLIALSGWGQERDRARALEVFDAHLTKPVELAALKQALGARDTASAPDRAP